MIHPHCMPYHARTLDSKGVLSYTHDMQFYRPQPDAGVQWRFLSFTGPDSRDFLHRITTANIKNLHPGQGSEACLLTAQGRIEATFTIWNTGPSEYLFEYDAGADLKAHELLLQTLDRYVFSDKVSFEPIPLSKQNAALWVFDPVQEIYGEVVPGSYETALGSSGLRLFNHGAVQYGRTWITLLGDQRELDRLGKGVSSVSLDTVEDWRIQALRPRIGFEINSSVNPLELGMLEWIAKGKGCYPGQEVIERVSSIGAPSRRLALLETAGSVVPDSIRPGERLVDSSGSEAGAITSVARDGSRVLALLKKSASEQGKQLAIQGNPSRTFKVSRIAPYA